MTTAQTLVSALDQQLEALRNVLLNTFHAELQSAANSSNSNNSAGAIVKQQHNIDLCFVSSGAAAAAANAKARVVSGQNRNMKQQLPPKQQPPQQRLFKVRINDNSDRLYLVTASTTAVAVSDAGSAAVAVAAPYVLESSISLNTYLEQLSAPISNSIMSAAAALQAASRTTITTKLQAAVEFEQFVMADWVVRVGALRMNQQQQQQQHIVLQVSYLPCVSLEQSNSLIYSMASMLLIASQALLQHSSNSVIDPAEMLREMPESAMRQFKLSPLYSHSHTAVQLMYLFNAALSSTGSKN